MIYFTYYQTSTGRSGHQLKDIMTVFMFSYFFENAVCVKNRSWNKQQLLPHMDCPHEKTAKYDKIIRMEANIKLWEGMSDEKFFETIQYIKNCSEEGENTLFVFLDVNRFHPVQLHNLFLSKKISVDYFTTKFLPQIRKFYYGTEEPASSNVVSIHVRRGDTAASNKKKGFHAQYYSRIIDIVNDLLNIPIHVYSEDYGSKDLEVLQEKPNVTLFLGGTKELKEHFYNIVSSKFLFLSNSSFATWAAYITLGTVFHETALKIKHFDHMEYPPNFIGYNIDDLREKVTKYTTQAK